MFRMRGRAATRPRETGQADVCQNFRDAGICEMNTGFGRGSGVLRWKFVG